MNTNLKRQEAQEEISLTSEGIAEMTKRCTRLQEQVSPLASRLTELKEEIKATDWTLTGQRPKGCTASTKDTTEKRSRLYAEHNEVARKLNELQTQLTPLNRHLSELRCHLATLEQSAITAETVQIEIDALSTMVTELEGERKALASILADAGNQLDEIARTAGEESDAAERLAAVRAKSFLSGPAETATLKRAIADAEKTLDRYREKALSALAAKPIVLARLESAKGELSSLDEQIAEQQNQLEEKRSQQRKIIALAQWKAVIGEVRKGVRNLLEADSAIGCSLVEALMREGLKEFDHRGRLVRPDWLQTGASGLNNI